MSIKNIFKKEITTSGGYVGGKSLKEVNSDGKKIYKLSSNENYFGTGPKALQAIVDSARDLNSYPEGTAKDFYQALSKFYHGQLSPDQFICANGGSEIIELVTRAFLTDSSNVIISNPCFSPYNMFSAWTGAEVRDVPLSSSNFELDVPGIINAIDQETRVIFLTSPNNPTGTYVSRRSLEDLLDQIPGHIVIIFDEVYHQFASAPDYVTALPYVNKGYPIIGINSFSKAYGLAGLRCGYGYSTMEISLYLRKIVRPFLINKLSLSASIAALDDVAFLDYTVQQIQENRSILFAGLQELGIKCWPSQGNFVLIQTDLGENELTEQMLQYGIMVRPAGNFGAPGCVRITIGDKEATQATLKALATILRR